MQVCNVTDEGRGRGGGGDVHGMGEWERGMEGGDVHGRVRVGVGRENDS